MKDFKEIVREGVTARLPILRAEIDAAWREHRYNGFYSETGWKTLRLESLASEQRRIPDSRYGEAEEIEAGAIDALLTELSDNCTHEHVSSERNGAAGYRYLTCDDCGADLGPRPI